MSRPEHEEPDPEAPLVVEGTVAETERYQPEWTILLRPAQTFVGLLPSHKNTRKGRRAGRQIKLVVAVLAFIAVISAQSTPVMILGIIALGIAPLVPISQARKRSWINRLKTLRDGRTRTVDVPAEIAHDGRRVSILRDGDRLRRVLVDREEHEVSAGTADDRLYLRIAPDDGNKDETIWVETRDVSPDELPDRWSVGEFSADRIDRPVSVDGSDWRALADELL